MVGGEKSFFGIKVFFFEMFLLGEIYITKSTIFTILSVLLSTILCSHHHHPLLELFGDPTLKLCTH